MFCSRPLDINFSLIQNSQFAVRSSQFAVRNSQFAVRSKRIIYNFILICNLALYGLALSTQGFSIFKILSWRFYKMKKFLVCLIFTLCTVAGFAQNVLPYIVDLNKMPTGNNDKTAVCDKATKTITITANDKLPYGGERSIYLWLNNLNISNYNIVRIKYKVTGDYGFNFSLDYDDDKLDWTKDKTIYCPSYLIPLVLWNLNNQ